ncbi:WG repeat-containing protein [Pedobacter sp.]
MKSQKSKSNFIIQASLGKVLTCIGVILSQFAFAQNPYKDDKGKWGIKDDNGKITIAAKFDKEFSFDGRKIIPVSLNGKTGFINTEGKTIVPFQYENAGNFNEGLAPIQLNKKWGFIDLNNKLVIKPQFNNAQSFNEGFAPYAEGGKWNGGDYPYFEGGKWGYIDKTGKIIIKAQFDLVGDFSEGLAAVGTNNNQSLFYGYINKTGKVVIKHFYNHADRFSNGIALVVIGDGASNNQHIFIKKDNTHVFSPIMCSRINGDGQTFKEKGKVKVYAFDDNFNEISYFINIKGEKVK